MRILIVALTVLAFTSLPAAAQNGQNSGAGHSFAGTTCSHNIPCPDSGQFPQTRDLVANANACITQFSGYNSPNGFFDEDAGLDTNYCLTAFPGVIPKGMGAELTPRCCVTKLQENVCTFRCDLVTVK